MFDYSQNKILLSPGELFVTFLLIQKSKYQWNAIIFKREWERIIPQIIFTVISTAVA
jgi:hypothetical protein